MNPWIATAFGLAMTNVPSWRALRRAQERPKRGNPSASSIPPMTPTELLERIAAGESQTLEFKPSFDKGSVASLVAFANTQGGTVLVGVTDAVLVQGVTIGKEPSTTGWANSSQLLVHCSFPTLAHQIDHKTVVSIQVGEFPVEPISTQGRYHKRIARSNHALALNEIADLYLQSLQFCWDATLRPRPARPACRPPQSSASYSASMSACALPLATKPRQFSVRTDTVCTILLNTQ